MDKLRGGVGPRKNERERVMSPETGSDAERSYQIGTVATLTGVDPHTIRAWERRYGAIAPSRSETGRRRYDDETVERLQLLKALVDCNESIGTIARLSDDDLRARLERLASLGRGSRTSGAFESGAVPRRLGLMAPELAAQLKANPIAFPELEIGFSASGASDFLDQLRRDPCAIVVVELDSLGRHALEVVRSCRDLASKPLVVVLYRFAPRTALARLAQAGARLVQSPVRLEQLRRILHDQRMIEQARREGGPLASTAPAVAEVGGAGTADAAAPPSESPVPTRRFDDEQLARLFEVSSGLDCECPNHLASLVAALVSFERYSLTCESRDEADAGLHRRLGGQTAAARALLEDVLGDLCRHEGIAI